jgi:hypothetical protein
MKNNKVNIKIVLYICIITFIAYRVFIEIISFQNNKQKYDKSKEQSRPESGEIDFKK